MMDSSRTIARSWILPIREFRLLEQSPAFSDGFSSYGRRLGHTFCLLPNKIPTCASHKGVAKIYIIHDFISEYRV